MAKPHTVGVHVVRVITDDLEHQFWAAATSREEAVARVLDCAPEGWTASLQEGQSISACDLAVLGLQPGDVRKLGA